MKIASILFWCSVALYGFSACLYIWGVISRSSRMFAAGAYSALSGLVPHIAVIALRWVEGGTPPFTAIAESIMLGCFMAVSIFLVSIFTNRTIRLLGAFIMPVVFVLMGWAGTLIKDPSTELAPALQSVWIWAHIVSASAGFGAITIAAGIGLLYLMEQRFEGFLGSLLPTLEKLDELSYRFVAGGFVMYGLMILSGCFWANEVKGNYWGWDPVEVWSLITWLIYGIYLHLRITFGWRGTRLAWYALIAIVAVIISYWGIPFAVENFHSGFRIEH